MLMRSLFNIAMAPNVRRFVTAKTIKLLVAIGIVWILFLCVIPKRNYKKSVSLCKQKEAIDQRVRNKEQISTNTRKEIKENLGKNISQLFFVTQRNSPEGTNLKHYLKSKKKTHRVSAEFYRLLPKDSSLGTNRRCSVVGNSGNMINSKCGKRIDSADFVYRCNIAPLKSFAEDSGLKSNITSFNPSILITRYNSLKKESDLEQFMQHMKEYYGYLWGACLSSSSHVPRCTKVLEKYNNTENKLVLGHPDHYQRITNFWKKLGLSKRPSTGFYFVTDALIRCSEVNLYGFWPFPHLIDSTIHDVPYHYFDDLKFPGTEGKEATHSMNEEFSVLLQLHLLGIIKLNIGVCSI